MNRFRSLAIAGLLAALPVGAARGQSQPSSSSSSQTVHGVVAAVHHEHHRITIRVHPQQSTSHQGSRQQTGSRSQHQGGHYTEWEFRVNGDTRFVTSTGTQQGKGNFHEVHRGSHIAIQTAASHPHLAAQIVIQRPQQSQTANKQGTQGHSATTQPAGTQTAATQPAKTPMSSTSLTKTSATGTASAKTPSDRKPSGSTTSTGTHHPWHHEKQAAGTHPTGTEHPWHHEHHHHTQSASTQTASAQSGSTTSSGTHHPRHHHHPKHHHPKR